MVVFDIIILVVFAYATIRGLFKGAISELASLFGVVLGIFCARSFSFEISESVATYFSIEEKYAVLISYLILFLGAILIVLLISRILNQILNKMMLGWLNKLFGGIYALTKYVLIASVLVFVFHLFNEQFHFLSKETIASSKLYQPLLLLAEKLLNYPFNSHINY